MACRAIISSRKTGYSTPRKRNGRAARANSNQKMPLIHSGQVNGLSIMICPPHKLQRRQLHILIALRNAHQPFQRRPVVVRLPQQIGQSQRHHERHRNTEPPARQDPPLRRQQQRNQNSNKEKSFIPFVLKPQPRADAQHDPPVANDVLPPRNSVLLHNAHQRQRAGHPEDRLKGIHRQKAIDPQVHARDDHAQHGQRSGPPVPALPNAHTSAPVRKTLNAPAIAESSRSDHMWSYPKRMSVIRACRATIGG